MPGSQGSERERGREREGGEGGGGGGGETIVYVAIHIICCILSKYRQYWGYWLVESIHTLMIMISNYC